MVKMINEKIPKYIRVVRHWEFIHDGPCHSIQVVQIRARVGQRVEYWPIFAMQRTSSSVGERGQSLRMHRHGLVIVWIPVVGASHTRVRDGTHHRTGHWDHVH